jgi:hypothetical protein
MGKYARVTVMVEQSKELLVSTKSSALLRLMVPPKVFLLIGMALCCSLSACSKKSAQGEGEAKIYGSLNPKDYIRPVIRREAGLSIPGCCTFDTGRTKVEILTSDEFVVRLAGRSFGADISFGFHSSLGTETVKSESSRLIDGVVVTGLKAVKDGNEITVTEITVTRAYLPIY